jgi:hypothetical protein
MAAYLLGFQKMEVPWTSIFELLTARRAKEGCVRLTIFNTCVYARDGACKHLLPTNANLWRKIA